MRYSIVFLLLLFISCKSIPEPKGTAAQYTSTLPEPQLSTIRIKTFIGYDSLFNRFLQVGQTIIKTTETNAMGFPYSGTLDQRVRYRLMDQDRLQVVFPMKWEAKPQLAGFSAGTLSAKSAVGITIHLQGKSVSNYQFDELHLSNQWIDKPSIKVLGFPVQVGTLVDQILLPKLPQLSNDLKSQLNQFVRPDQLSNAFLTGFLTPVGLNLDPFAIDFQDLRLLTAGLSGDLLIQTRLVVGKDFLPKSIIPSFKPLSSIDNSVTYAVNLTLEEIREMVAIQLKTNVSTIFLELSAGKQEFVCRVLGRRPAISFRFSPILLDDSTIGIKVHGLDLDNLGLFKSMFRAPIKRRIIGGIHSQRMTSEQLLLKVPTQFQGLQITNRKLLFHAINYSDDRIQVLGKLSGDWTLRK
jgi:hypothetical protein